LLYTQIAGVSILKKLIFRGATIHPSLVTNREAMGLTLCPLMVCVYNIDRKESIGIATSSEMGSVSSKCPILVEELITKAKWSTNDKIVALAIVPGLSAEGYIYGTQTTIPVHMISNTLKHTQIKEFILDGKTYKPGDFKQLESPEESP
jgi:hypothetical protein